jgi:integrase
VRVRTSTLKQTRTGAYKSRQRVPPDIAEDYKQLYGQAWEVKFFAPSGTTLADAKRLFAEWTAAHLSRIAALRAARSGSGRDLTTERARALSGDWYRWWTKRHAGASDGWLDHLLDCVQGELERAAGESLLARLGDDPWEAWKHDPDVRDDVRPVVADLAETAQFLSSQGFALTAAAQRLLFDFIASDLAGAIRFLKRRLDGDFSDDAYCSRFPKEAEGGRGKTAAELFETWRTERRPSSGTIETWQPILAKLAKAFPDGGPSTRDDALRWLKERINEKTKRGVRSAATVKNNWLRACNTVFAWATVDGLVSCNPFKDIKLTVPKREQLRDTKAFRANESAKILIASLAIADVTKPADAAKRWVPWLCAYSGARPGEITQLRGCDVKQLDGIWALLLTPEAGTIKSRKARFVPLHEHLIAQGFLKFVASKGSGPLFYKPPNSVSVGKKPRAAQTRQRLAAWVRALGITDRELSPNHAWRHTFKQIAERHDISVRTSDYITGHSPKSVANSYGAPTLEDMANALKRFPHFQVNHEK